MPRIEKIECFFLRYPYPEDIRYVYSGGRCDNMDAALVRVTCDNGETGLGEITHGQFTYEPIPGLVAHFERLLKGHELGDINRAWELMYGSSIFWNREGLGIGVMGGIDLALHDALGKTLGLPVWQLLGGRARNDVRIYASNGLFDQVEPLIADARRAQARGFDAYKMRVVRPEATPPLVAAFRETFADDLDLAVDAVQGSCAVPWPQGLVKRLVRALEPCDLMWLEEPCRVENIEGYRELRRATSLTVAGAESIPTARAFKPYLEAEAFGLVQFDIATSGFSEGRRIAALAALHQKPVGIHSWGSQVSIMAGIHMAIATANVAITEFCFMDHPLNERLALAALEISNGRVAAPQAPGLGVVFDPALADEFPYVPGTNTMILTDQTDMRLT